MNKRRADFAALRAKQALPLERKIAITQTRIIEFCHKVPAYLSFSGGKDSTVLNHIVSQMEAAAIIEKIPRVYVNTFYEWPDVRNFVKAQENVTILKPLKLPQEVLEKDGFPIYSKEIAQRIEAYRKTHNETYITGRFPEQARPLLAAPFKISPKCCSSLKKEPFKRYQRETGRARITGLRAEESFRRAVDLAQSGCNVFGKEPHSAPMSFWLSCDVDEYIKRYRLDLPGCYKYVGRTGCMFCLFGAHCPGDNRLAQIREHYPAFFNFCLEKLGFGAVIKWLHTNTALRYNLGKQGCFNF